MYVEVVHAYSGFPRAAGLGNLSGYFASFGNFLALLVEDYGEAV